jgi:hypothetical protein
MNSVMRAESIVSAEGSQAGWSVVKAFGEAD